MIILILTGLVTGIISGMGIGGGTVLIPILTLLLGVAQKSAQGINLLNFLPTATIALIAHMRAKRVRKDLWLGLVMGGVVGAVIGSWLANALHPMYLRKGFGFFLLLIGLTEVFKKVKPENTEEIVKEVIDQKNVKNYNQPRDHTKSKLHRMKNKRKE